MIMDTRSTRRRSRSLTEMSPTNTEGPAASRTIPETGNRSTQGNNSAQIAPPTTQLTNEDNRHHLESPMQGSNPESIPSPAYSSLTAQNIRREFQLQHPPPTPDQAAVSNGVREIINSSIRLARIEFQQMIPEIIEATRRLHVGQEVSQSQAQPPRVVPESQYMIQGLERNVTINQVSATNQMHPTAPPPIYSQAQVVNQQPQVAHETYQNGASSHQTQKPPQQCTFSVPQENRDPPISAGNLPSFASIPNIRPDNNFGQQPMSWAPPVSGMWPQQALPYYNMPYRNTPFDQQTRINLSRWGLKFDGLEKSMNVQEFIFRAGELKRDYNCPEQEFVTNFHQLLEKPALDWFWNHRKMVQFRSWEEIRSALLNQYQRYEDDVQIQRKILNRRQLPQEPFEEFYNAVVGLNNQQRCPYDETKLMGVLRTNLKPSLSNMIFAVSVRNLAEFCRVVKSADCQLMSQRQQFQQRQFQKVNEIDIDGDIPTDQLEVEALRDTSKYKCWNCKIVGHGFMDCPSATRRLFCYKCGWDNVVSPKCPRCQGNVARNPPQTGEVRSTQV